MHKAGEGGGSLVWPRIPFAMGKEQEAQEGQGAEVLLARGPASLQLRRRKKGGS